MDKNIKIKTALLGVFLLSFLGMGPITGGSSDATAPAATAPASLQKYLSVCRIAVSKAPTWSEAVRVLKTYEDQGLTSLSDFCSFYMRGRVDQHEIENTWKTPVSLYPIVPHSKQPRLKDPNEEWLT